MAAVEEMAQIALRVRPDLITLVPERREELTTEGGLNVRARPDHYRRIAEAMRAAGIHVSFFVDPDPGQVKMAHQCGADIVEIHTGHYAEAQDERETSERFSLIAHAVDTAAELNLRISAGHGLDYRNIQCFKTLPRIEEYSIGHSIVARAVFVGIGQAVREMVHLVKGF
jgi:pyridoxine 5-phosphate synthase